ncbi:Uncharacterized protein Rs2_09402 [Raphanus sativus]|nr:Uncharacterized protein Rs2_09402 [Raphanus sativus]
MPMLAPSVPPGFAPRPNLVAPEVFEQMQLYMNCTDPEERRIREFKMKSVLDELSKDPVAQRFALRLESAPQISNVLNKDVGEIYKPPSDEEDRVQEIVGTSTPGPQSFDEARGTRSLIASQKQWSAVAAKESITTPLSKLIPTLEAHNPIGEHQNLPMGTMGVFSMGMNPTTSSSSSARAKTTVRKPSSWKRQATSGSKKRKEQDDEPRKSHEDRLMKQKANEDGEVSSKISKHAGGLMVHQKPSSPQ